MRGELNIDSTELQIVEGAFPEQPSWGEIESTCEIRMDRFHLYKNEVRFDGYVPSPGLNEILKYVTKNGYELHLVNTGSYFGGRASATFFTIKEIVFEESSTKYLRTGTVKNMVYFPRELNLFGNHIIKKEYKFDVNGRPKTDMYFEFEGKISREEIDKCLLSLSVLSCNKLTLMEFCDGRKVTIKNNKSSSTEVTYFGSGIMFYPIRVQEVETLVYSTDWERLYKIFLAYSKYCTTSFRPHQLYGGCSVLEYLVDLFWKSLDMEDLKGCLKAPLRKHRRSAKLFGVLLKLELTDVQIEFVESIFPELSFSKLHIPKKFEFFELRDRHIHRGELFMMESDMESYRRSLASLNEIIRLLIPFVRFISNWEMDDHPHMKTEGTTEIVNIRQKLMSFDIT